MMYSKIIITLLAIQSISVMNFSLIAGENTGIGGAGARMIGPISSGGFGTMNNGSSSFKRTATAIQMQEAFVQGVTTTNDRFLDYYDLKHTDAGRRLGIKMRRGMISVPVESSRWKQIELISGDTILKSRLQKFKVPNRSFKVRENAGGRSQLLMMSGEGSDTGGG